jgi:hypothetical protein
MCVTDRDMGKIANLIGGNIEIQDGCFMKMSQ